MLDKMQYTTRCRFSERFASAWPELIIACDVRGRGEWLHGCSWPPLQLACAAYGVFAHAFLAFRLQTDRRDRHHNRVTYCLFQWGGLIHKKYPKHSKRVRNLDVRCNVVEGDAAMVHLQKLYEAKYAGQRGDRT